MQLKMSELKAMKRAASRRNSKLSRKVETARKLREDLYNLNRKTVFLGEELRELLDLSKDFQRNS